MNQQNMTGMTDQVIATDCLLSAKTGIKSYAVALAESATPEVREALKRQLNTAIDTHEQISNYMISKGYYHPDSIQEQLTVDLQATNTALNLSNQQQQQSGQQQQSNQQQQNTPSQGIPVQTMEFASETDVQEVRRQNQQSAQNSQQSAQNNQQPNQSQQ